ncbi:Mitogen-activated protein kinase kinase kinase 2 [Diplonema papillatum]|nr:Mitogen-activated protein kinase kinase kinase 2 [Diplonema papillatum]
MLRDNPSRRASASLLNFLQDGFRAAQCLLCAWSLVLTAALACLCGIEPSMPDGGVGKALLAQAATVALLCFAAVLIFRSPSVLNYALALSLCHAEVTALATVAFVGGLRSSGMLCVLACMPFAHRHSSWWFVAHCVASVTVVCLSELVFTFGSPFPVAVDLVLFGGVTVIVSVSQGIATRTNTPTQRVQGCADIESGSNHRKPSRISTFLRGKETPGDTMKGGFPSLVSLGSTEEADSSGHKVCNSPLISPMTSPSDATTLRMATAPQVASVLSPSVRDSPPAPSTIPMDVSQTSVGDGSVPRHPSSFSFCLLEATSYRTAPCDESARESRPYNANVNMTKSGSPEAARCHPKMRPPIQSQSPRQKIEQRREFEGAQFGSRRQSLSSRHRSLPGPDDMGETISVSIPIRVSRGGNDNSSTTNNNDCNNSTTSNTSLNNNNNSNSNTNSNTNNNNNNSGTVNNNNLSTPATPFQLALCTSMCASDAASMCSMSMASSPRGAFGRIWGTRSKKKMPPALPPTTPGMHASQRRGSLEDSGWSPSTRRNSTASLATNPNRSEAGDAGSSTKLEGTLRTRPGQDEEDMANSKLGASANNGGYPRGLQQANAQNPLISSMNVRRGSVGKDADLPQVVVHAVKEVPADGGKPPVDAANPQQQDAPAENPPGRVPHCDKCQQPLSPFCPETGARHKAVVFIERLTSPTDSEAHCSNGSGSFPTRQGRASRVRSDSIGINNPSAVRIIKKTIHWTRCQMLGQGAHGKVYKGLLQETGEFVAVKQVEFSTKDPNVQFRIKALQREIEIMKHLNHEHIVRYFFTESVNNSVNIFMEFVPGGSLQNLLGSSGPLQESTVVQYTYQILVGVAYLHMMNVIHRDIKGANVLLTVEGLIKLADFGASSIINSGIEDVQGTPYWMAPEVIQATEQSWEADIWSLGCTVMEMLTAMHPWEHLGMTPMDTVAWVVDADHPIVTPPGVTKASEHFLRDCLKRNQTLRPSAQALIEHHYFLEDAEEMSREIAMVMSPAVDMSMSALGPPAPSVAASVCFYENDAANSSDDEAPVFVDKRSCRPPPLPITTSPSPPATDVSDPLSGETQRVTAGPTPGATKADASSIPPAISPATNTSVSLHTEESEPRRMSASVYPNVRDTSPPGAWMKDIDEDARKLSTTHLFEPPSSLPQKTTQGLDEEARRPSRDVQQEESASGSQTMQNSGRSEASPGQNAPELISPRGLFGKQARSSLASSRRSTITLTLSPHSVLRPRSPHPREHS